MKKIMCILAFVGIGLFATASNEKKGITSLLTKEIVNELKEVSLPPSVYIKIHCGNGDEYYVCCYWSTFMANLAAPDWAATLCD